jgi:hypothetical protein
MLVSCVPLAFVLPDVLTRAALRKVATGTLPIPPRANPADYRSVPGQLLGVYQTSLIVGLALLEGTAFMGSIAFLLEAVPLAAGVTGLALLMMLLKFPTRRGVHDWLERQADRLAEIRQQSVPTTEA